MQHKFDLSEIPTGKLFVQLLKNSISRSFLLGRILELDVPDSVKLTFIKATESADGIQSTRRMVDELDPHNGDDPGTYLLENTDWEDVGRTFKNLFDSPAGQEAKPNEKSWIYFIASAESGLIKIGRSINPKGRFNAIRTMSPEVLTLLGAIPEDSVTELDLHTKFSHLRRHGEWFEDCPEIREYLDGLELSA